MALMQLCTGSVTLVCDKICPMACRDEHTHFFIGRGLPTIEGQMANIVTCPNHVSKFHAAITYSNGIYYIQDLNSVNGTYVNDILYRGGDPIPLPNFCLISLGGKLIIGNLQAGGFKNPFNFIFISVCDEDSLPLHWQRPVIADHMDTDLGLLASVVDSTSLMSMKKLRSVV